MRKFPSPRPVTVRGLMAAMLVTSACGSETIQPPRRSGIGRRTRPCARRCAATFLCRRTGRLRPASGAGPDRSSRSEEIRQHRQGEADPGDEGDTGRLGGAGTHQVAVRVRLQGQHHHDCHGAGVPGEGLGQGVAPHPFRVLWHRPEEAQAPDPDGSFRDLRPDPGLAAQDQDQGASSWPR